MRKYLWEGVAVLLALAMYLPTLRTGFLTDDFLDAQTTFSDSSRAFTAMLSSGYRPLMSFSWAIDNWIWGTGRQWGWHLTNIVILIGALVSLRSFLKLFVTENRAILAGLALFAFSTPVAASVAKTDWRTSLLPVIPLLWSMYFLVRYSRKEKCSVALTFSSLLLLVSVFLKEIALAVPPAFAVLAWSQSNAKESVRRGIRAFAAAAVPVLVYLFARYLTVGFAIGYSESSTFGLFMFKNILILMGKAWAPWLSSVPARMLLPFFGVALWLLPADRKLKIFLAVISFFILLTVGNLSPRVDYAVPVIPVFSLSLAMLVQRYSSRRVLAVVVLLLSAVFLNSIDEIRLIRGASDLLRNETGRMAGIAREIPGNGPLFLWGVRETYGSYGTFWHGEYGMPMEYIGIDPGRTVTGTDRIWQVLVESAQPGNLIFLGENGEYKSYPVSLDMYTELPDTAVMIAGPLVAGSLIRYPACTATGPDDKLLLLSPILPDSLLEISSIQHDGRWCFDLASVPVWLAGDRSTVIITDSDELFFTHGNIAELNSIDVIAAKRHQH